MIASVPGNADFLSGPANARNTMGIAQLIACIAAALLHFGFAFGEMVPWHCPRIMGRVLQQRKMEFTSEQLKLVATIARNAGIYNVIVGASFVLAGFPGFNDNRL